MHFNRVEITPPAVEPLSRAEAYEHLNLHDAESLPIGTIAGGPYLDGEIIQGSTSAATANVAGDHAVGPLAVYNVLGTFQAGENVVGATSGATAIATGTVQSEQGDYVDTLIDAARRQVENHTSRRLITQTWDVLFDRFPCGRAAIEIPLSPVETVESLKYVDTEGAEQTMPPADYREDLTSIVPRLTPVYETYWPHARRVTNAVVVRVVAGYGTAGSAVPENLRHAMKLLIGHWFANREAVIVGTISEETPIGYDALINPYRIQARVV